jgi:prefoldin subunit 5
MNRPTIKSLQQEISELQSHADSLRRQLREHDDRLSETRQRNRKLMQVARDERKDYDFMRRRMNEVHESILKIRQRIAFAIDCVGGRSGGECVPMGAKLYVNVEAILARAIDIPASNAACESDVKNMEAHKHIRSGQPSIDALDMDAT